MFVPCPSFSLWTLSMEGILKKEDFASLSLDYIALGFLPETSAANMRSPVAKCCLPLPPITVPTKVWLPSAPFTIRGLPLSPYAPHLYLGHARQSCIGALQSDSLRESFKLT